MTTPILVPYEKQRYGNPDTEKLNQSLDRVIMPILGKEILDGKLFDGQHTGVGILPFSHSLGREYRGYVVVRRQGIGPGNIDIWEEYTSGQDLNKFIYLGASAAVIFRIWIF